MLVVVKVNQKTGCLSIQKKKEKKPKKMPRHPVSLKGVLLIVLLDFFKVSKMTNFNYDLFKVITMTNFNFDLFKVRYIFLWYFFYG